MAQFLKVQYLQSPLSHQKIKMGFKKYLHFAAEAPNDAETEENLGIYSLDIQDVCQMFPQSGSLSSCRPRFISAV